MTRRLRCQAGIAMIEFALTIGLLMLTIVTTMDLYLINQLRGNYDRISHNLASILSVQKYLSATDLDKLISKSLSESEIGQYELNIYKVNLDRSMEWKPLIRGQLSDVCSSISSPTGFSGDLPEENKDKSDASIIVVQLCRESEGLTPFTSLLSNRVIEVKAYNRMAYSNIRVDDRLAKELGIDEDE